MTDTLTITDTDPAAANYQIGLLQAMTTKQRLALTLALSDAVIQLSRRAIRRAHLEFSEDEVKCRFVELHYGEPLAKKLRQYFEELRNRSPK